MSPLKTFSLSLLLACLLVGGPTAADDLPPTVLQAEERRIATVRKITPATIAIFEQAGTNGGSGVIISPDGYALTNFHVVAPCGPTMSCGLPDGSLVEAVLVGLDPTGDIALIRLRGERDFPVAEIGNSDTAMIGDEVFVAGNPFLLADDFRPTITHGVLSGTRRYQYPAGTVLEYADCLQTDAAINPGNSGGPLYDAGGRLIGINGRGSFEKRGRVNVGVGYAVSINQVMRFVDQLKGGRIVDHGLLGATARTTSDRRVVIDAIDTKSDAYRRGLRLGDEVLAFAGQRLTSANALLNAVATHPADWTASLRIRRDNQEQTLRVRLAPKHAAGELEQVVAQQMPHKDEHDRIAGYEFRPGYANYACNRRQVRRLVGAFINQSGGPPSGDWRIDADGPRGAVTIELGRDRIAYESAAGRSWIDANRPLHTQAAPAGSGGLLVALEAWRALLAADPQSPDGFIYHGSTPWQSEGKFAERVTHPLGDGVTAEYYFGPDSGRLIGIQAWLDDAQDPCRVVLGNYRSDLAPSGVGDLPASWSIAWGDRPWATLTIRGVSINPDDVNDPE